PVRSFEFEADYLAIKYLFKSGYDPRALAWLLEKIGTTKNQKRIEARDGEVPRNSGRSDSLTECRAVLLVSCCADNSRHHLSSNLAFELRVSIASCSSCSPESNDAEFLPNSGSFSTPHN